jgi:hypothetical protein
MDFGNSKNSSCGICRKPEEGFWKGDELVADIICDVCSADWVYDDEQNEYIRKAKVNFLIYFFLFIILLIFFLLVCRLLLLKQQKS